MIFIGLEELFGPWGSGPVKPFVRNQHINCAGSLQMYRISTPTDGVRVCVSASTEFVLAQLVVECPAADAQYLSG